MKRVGPFDLTNFETTYGDTAFADWTNGNRTTGVKGSRPPIEAVTHPMEELVHLVEFAGLTPDNADLQQVRKAIQAMTTEAVVSGLDVPGANQSITSGVSATIITYGAADNNTLQHSVWSGSTLTIGAGDEGRWILAARVVVDPAVSNVPMRAGIQLNTVEFVGGTNGGAPGYSSAITLAFSRRLEVDDAIRVAVRQDSGSAKNAFVNFAAVKVPGR